MSATSFADSTMMPVPPGWTAAQLPAVHGQIVIVTGGATGLGFHTSLELARRGAHVVIACHIDEQGRDAVLQIHDLLSTNPEKDDVRVEYMHLDVSDLASIERFVTKFQAHHDRLDVLIHNAGIFPCKPYSGPTHNAAGLEMTFATNYLGPFALTARLLGLLRQSDAARVVTVGSMLHKQAKAFDLADLPSPGASDSPAKVSAGAIQLYAQSKFYLMLFTLELDRRLRRAGIRNVRAIATHPGISATSMMTADAWSLGIHIWFSHELAKWLMHPPHQGAWTTLYAAAAPGVQGGAYVGPDGLLGIYGHPCLDCPSTAAMNEPDAQALWSRSENLTELAFTIE